MKRCDRNIKVFIRNTTIITTIENTGTGKII